MVQQRQALAPAESAAAPGPGTGHPACCYVNADLPDDGADAPDGRRLRAHEAYAHQAATGGTSDATGTCPSSASRGAGVPSLLPVPGAREDGRLSRASR